MIKANKFLKLDEKNDSIGCVTNSGQYIVYCTIRSKVDVIRNVAENRLLWYKDNLISREQALSEITKNEFNNGEVKCLINQKQFKDYLLEENEYDYEVCLNKILDSYINKGFSAKKFLRGVLNELTTDK